MMTRSASETRPDEHSLIKGDFDEKVAKQMEDHQME